MSDEGTTPATATLEEAREHARAQVAERQAAERTGPTIPVAAVADLPPGVAAASVVWDETIGAGGYTARRLDRDTVLRVEDTGGDACVQILVYNATNTAERLNVADTVKVQWQAYLGRGALLLSDLGRVLLTIVEDTSERHDCLCGASNRCLNDARYGDGSVSGPAPNARDLLVLAGLKHGLGRVDIAPSINLFKTVTVHEDGGLELSGEPTEPSHVHLRAELDVIVLVANTPHPLDDRPDYDASRVRLTAWHEQRPPDDPWRSTTPERERAFLNTDDHLLEVGR